MADWTKSETIAPPVVINVSYDTIATAGSPSVKKTVPCTSTSTSTNFTSYQTFPYTDADGNRQQQDMVVYKEDIKTTTKADVNLQYVQDRAKYGLGLPPGNDVERSVTTYEYFVGTDGPKLVREVTNVYISYVALAGQLQGIPYAFKNPGDSSTTFYDPPSGETVSTRTIIEYEEAKGADGRDYTRKKTSRYIAAANASEAKESFLKWMQGLKRLGLLSAAEINDALYSYAGLRFEGTEVTVEIGRAPVPSKPSDSELKANEVTNGVKYPSNTPAIDKYGNDKNWPAYVPPGTDPESFNKDSNGDGVPDWAEFVPTTPDFYQPDSNNDGIPDWQDPGGTGIPDWADFVPVYDADQIGTSAFIDDAAGSIDTPPAPPADWNDYTTDSNGDGVDDWAPFVPSEMLGTAPFIAEDGVFPDNYPPPRTDPEDYDQDSNGDGVPDWAPFVPIDTAEALAGPFIADNSGTIDAPPFTPTDWNDYTPGGDTVETWPPFVPVGPGDFDTGGTDYVNPTPEVSNERTITGRVIFDGSNYDDGDPTVTATYDMPYAPDDYFDFVKKVRKLIPNGAAAAAERFGRTEALLDIGHAYGVNIVTGFQEMPTLELSPLYIRLAGVEGAFLTDSLSYAWGPEGMVVSSDLMLLGATGYYGDEPPDASWLRLPVPAASLAPVPDPLTESAPRKANTLPLPAGFSVSNPGPVLQQLPRTRTDVFAVSQYTGGLVGPALELLRVALMTGPSLQFIEYPYELTLPAETQVIATAPLVEFQWLTQVTVPSAAVVPVAGLAPSVSTGARVVPPSASTAVAAMAPSVSTGVSVAVPAASVAVAGVAPDLVGRQKTQVLVPAAGITVAGSTPSVSTGASVAAPTKATAVAGVVPTAIGAHDPSFSSVSLLLHMDGSNNSTTFTDNSSNAFTVSRFGDAKISTAQSKFGGASGLFDGTGDYLTCPSASGAFNFGSGNFTIEVWVRVANITGVKSVATVWPSDANASWRFLISDAGVFLGWKTTTGSTVLSGSGAVLSANTWAHLAIVRNGGTLTIYKDGVSVKTDTISGSIANASSTLSIGRNEDANTWFMNGYMDDLRITKGVARYTANFTPPTAPFPDR